MKHPLLALALLGASGAALAQSSVTLYGVADATLVKLQGQRARMGGGPADVMTNADSRLGVQGTEDLGGGLYAGFQFETRLSLTGGGTLCFDAACNFWSPTALVWIGSPGWGGLILGRKLSPSFNGVYAWELTAAANYSVVGKTYFFAGGDARNASELAYKTPSLGGLSAEVAYITKPDMQAALPRAQGARWEMNAIYQNGPATLALAASKIKAEKTNGSLGGSYDFGPIKVAASYNITHNNVASYGTRHANLYARRDGVTLGATVPLGPFTLTADLARDTRNEIVAGVPGRKSPARRQIRPVQAHLRVPGRPVFGQDQQLRAGAATQVLIRHSRAGA